MRRVQKEASAENAKLQESSATYPAGFEASTSGQYGPEEERKFPNS